MGMGSLHLFLLSGFFLHLSMLTVHAPLPPASLFAQLKPQLYLGQEPETVPPSVQGQYSTLATLKDDNQAREIAP